jgi:hypothetical protein
MTSASSQIALPWAKAFLAKVLLDDDEECWLWTGSVNHTTGYGQLSWRINKKHKALYAHRCAWELWQGSIAKGLTVDHLCFNKLCCNPLHMELVTLSENGRRGAVKRWRGTLLGKSEALLR